MALLTPNDIRNHRFNTTRFREGYDIDEVDSFLDEVTETIDALSSNAMNRTGAAAMVGPAHDDEKVKELEGKNKELEAQLEELKKANQQGENKGQKPEQEPSEEVQKELESLKQENEDLKKKAQDLEKAAKQASTQKTESTDGGLEKEVAA